MAVALLVGPKVFAAEATNTANTLKVSPVRTDINIKAGETQTVKVTVTNLTNSVITVMPIENDFIAGDERGTPALILDADKYAPTHSLKRFMSPLSAVTIPAKKAVVVDVLIAVPKDAQPGGYFGAVRFAPTTPDSGGQVNLSASVASIILMTVPGPVTEKLNLTDFDIQQNGVTGTYFHDGNNLQLALRFENKGSLQLGPFGKVSVTRGSEIVYEADFNNESPREMVLPDSARRWEMPLKGIDGFGYYTLNATFTYGTKNQTIEVTKSFWVIPWAYIIAAIVIVVVLILGILITVFILKRRKRKVSLGHGRSSYRR